MELINVEEGNKQESSLERVFNTYINLLKQGYVYFGYQDDAMHMANRWGLSTKKVEEATRKGFEVKYKQCNNFIELGVLEQEKRAREIATQHGFSLEPLEHALEIGKIKAKGLNA